jgi:outer membrane protein assembly factor BamD
MRSMIPLILALAGCSGAAGKFPAGSYERGVAEFEAEHYFEAVEDLKLFVRRNPTDPKVDEAQYHIALSRFRDKDYPVAAVEFEILRSDYPHSARVDDAWYMEGLCYQRQAPSLVHDQTPTRRALEHFQRYLRQFPGGARHDDALTQATALQEQLDRKRLEAVTLYERLGQDRAALVTLQALLDDRPDSILRPEMLYLAGTLAVRLGEADEARAFWKEVVTLAPDTDSAQRATKGLEELGREENGSSR